MKIRISREEFVNLFDEYNRTDNFSRLGRRKLFDYLEQYEEETDTDLDIDIIGLCCEYAEDDTVNVLKEYNLESIEDLRENTTVIEVDTDRIIYQSY